jgi:hypothetical protein
MCLSNNNPSTLELLKQKFVFSGDVQTFYGLRTTGTKHI